VHDWLMIDDSFALRYDIVSMNGWFLVFQRQYATSEHREPITQ
jgi:hypothetical protein